MQLIYIQWKLECIFQDMVSITLDIHIQYFINNLIVFYCLFADPEDYRLEEFVTLKDGSEGLLIVNRYDNKYKFLDPYHPSDAIDITDDITNDITKPIVITQSNKKFYIKEN